MIFNRDDPSTWPYFKPLIIAHDVGRSRDRSTAVIGGNCPNGQQLIGIRELLELPLGLYGSARASTLAEIDRRYHSNAIIVVDLSNDASYAEVLFQMFGTRLIGFHISRHGDGTSYERRLVNGGSILVYTVGRTYLIEKFHSVLCSDQVRFVDDPMSRRGYDQLASLQAEMRETGTVYTCPAGQHDDLGMSCAMLACAAQHPHVGVWTNTIWSARRPRIKRQKHGWGAFV